MSRRSPFSSSRGRKPGQPELPKGYTLINDIFDSKNLCQGSMVSVVGIVKDYRLPMQSRGTDYKSTMTLADLSNDDQGTDIDFFIFRKEDQMPTVEASDVVVVNKAKLQERNSAFSLITNRATEIHVYEAQRILRTTGSAFGALRPTNHTERVPPDSVMHKYVSWMYHHIDKENIPDQDTVRVKAAQSANVKQKFSLLKDIKESKFVDLVVQVVRDPYPEMDMATLWVSDYTEHPSFFNRAYDGVNIWGGFPARDGDPYGYTGKFNTATRATGPKYTGPYGKKSMQITAWPPHAEFLLTRVKAGDWVSLRNVQIRFGRNASNLEGAMRSDRDHPDRLYVQPLDPQEDRERIDPRLIEAIRRKRDYEKEKREQLRSLKSELAGTKRKEGPGHEPKKDNSKARRKKQRAAKQKQVEKQEQHKEELLGLNELIRCENNDKQLAPLSTVLEPVKYETILKSGETATVELPFTCAKYRTNARVVDFHPAKLEDFAVSRKQTEYDVLSDAGGLSSGESESEGDDGTLAFFAGKRVWEWRFALKLEDPSATSARGKKPATMWAVVDNNEAQLLTGLDASDLRSDADKLSDLREQMFKLWGDLEERKVAIEARKKKIASGPILLDRPPLDSSDGEDDMTTDAQVKEPGLSQTSNKPFTCCLRQYGVRIRAQGSEDANAGEGMRWQRVFGLFGTKISL